MSTPSPPASVGVRGSMVIRLRSCMISSTPRPNYASSIKPLVDLAGGGCGKISTPRRYPPDVPVLLKVPRHPVRRSTSTTPTPTPARSPVKVHTAPLPRDAQNHSPPPTLHGQVLRILSPEDARPGFAYPRRLG